MSELVATRTDDFWFFVWGAVNGVLFGVILAFTASASR